MCPNRNNKRIENYNLSVLIANMLSGHWNFLTHNSLELMFINDTIGVAVTPSPWGGVDGGSYGLGPVFFLRF